MGTRSSRRTSAVLLVLTLLVSVLAVAAGGAASDATAQADVSCTWRGLGNLNRNVAYAASAMDTDAGVMYVYGGYGDDSTNFQTESAMSSIAFGAALTTGDTTVANASVAGSPEREALAGVYRPKGDDSAVYWIGGRDNSGQTSSDVQVYTVKSKAWSTLSTSGTFGTRDEHAAAYDPKHDVIWVAAGEVSACTSVPCTAPQMPTNYLAFDPATGAASWHDGPSGAPRAKGGSMVYDASRERMVFFGGTLDGDKGTGQLYVLDLSDNDVTKAAWSALSATGSGPAVAVHGAAYHAARDWMVVYGGMKSSYAQAGKETGETRTFALDFSVDPPAWRNLTATIGDRIQPVMEYLPQHEAIVLSSGRVALPDPATSFNKRSIHALVCEDVVPPTPTPTRDAGTGEGETCASIQSRVPQAAINDAMANPSAYGGWDLPCNPNLPPNGALNPMRRHLDLLSSTKPYHPLYNGLAWRCGCR